MAEQFLGAPYVWGGKTFQGIDCSGLIQTSLQAAGQTSPRDTDMMEQVLGRTLLRDFLKAQGSNAVASFVNANLPARSEWPDTANRLVYRYLQPVLLTKDRPPALRGLLDDIVERAVLANARSRQMLWRRMILQFRTTWTLSSTESFT